MRNAHSTAHRPPRRWLGPVGLAVMAWALSTGPLAACQSAKSAQAAKAAAAAPAPAAPKAAAASATPAAAPPAAKAAAPGAEKAAAVEATLPKSVDPKDLDADERALLAGVLHEQFDPCGGSRSFYDSLASAAPCERAQHLAAKLVALTAEGLSKRQLTQALLSELSRTKAKAVFTLDGRPPLGDPSKARHVIVEFTDFQCPYCRGAAPQVEAAAKKHGAVLYVKHMPLPQHAAARPAARVAVAAARQGKFWAVYDALFAHQDALLGEDATKAAVKIAVDAGADAAKLAEALKDPAADALIKADEAEGDAAGVDGTPTVFVDGYRVDLDDLDRTLAVD